MKVSFANTLPLEITGKAVQREVSGSSPSFAGVLQKALGEVNELQLQADRLAEKFVVGEVEDLHQVMLATERAYLALQLTVQVRNKIIEAYQEISRMQI
ncbi:flagellar hook-basal body complex protein FliE [Calderihabitans maritimus]|uniref:Flagellar hook-basal body complex protein FliE n=1 Tax=Calderihabitans maritimus TaxID=1246530 RepID=A0A1Z5HUB0_9FIRM|nr:flagellar hook-basal body complex protein FliE [Calderihabitans maritimus]GAW92915.1 flagellar hook-basal body protein FliE [Calderihabitans maritimus]